MSSGSQNLIPADAITVETSHSTYKLGPADTNGDRTVYKNGKPLSFVKGAGRIEIRRCRILALCKGEKMFLKLVEPKIARPWATSEVQSIAVDRVQGA
ncbi:MAG: hypothetical protein ABSA74_02150 [Candidatus Staskawiczbacteria bacterium]|jgi:hypothetical protein